MIDKLKKLLNNSHSPYSNVKVSSIVIANKKEYKGVNVENAAFGSTICAERNAMLAAISDGNKAGDISDIHLTSSLTKPLFPCGSCLQVMSELGSKNLKIHVHHEENVEIYSLNELLPFAIKESSFEWK